MSIHSSFGRPFQHQSELTGKRNVKHLRLFLLSVYQIIFLLVFIPLVDYPVVGFFTCAYTSVCLWFGILKYLGSDYHRALYDPQTLFNLGAFYYGFQGIAAGWGEYPRYLSILTITDIVSSYPFVTLYSLAGVLVWNLTYETVIRNFEVERAHSNRLGKKSQSSSFVPSPLSITILATLGLLAALILFRSVGGDFLFFIRDSWKRGYLSSDISGVGSGLSSLAYYLLALLAPSSMLWLATISVKCRQPGAMWWGFTLFVLTILLLVVSRAVLLGAIIGLMLVYHLLIRRISISFIGVAAAIALSYSYLIQVWRKVARTVGDDSFSEWIAALTNELSFRGAVDFLTHGSLVDIRVFSLIYHVYGESLPLKYGETLLRIFYQFIPRSFWPSKPYDLGLELEQLSRDSNSGFPPGFFGEMYMNFHVPGVILGCFLLAVVIANLYIRWIVSDDRSALSVVLYSIMAYRIALITSNTISSAIGIVLVPICAVYVISMVFKANRVRQ